MNISTAELAERTAEVMALQIKGGPEAASNAENMAELHKRERAGENVPSPQQIRQRAHAIIAAA